MIFIYALLLITNSLSNNPARIVFSSTVRIDYEHRTNYNDVYEISNPEFPKPEDDSGIFMIIDDSSAQGTHIAVYISDDKSYAEMMAEIMGGSSPLTEEKIISLDKDARAVQECYQYLQSSPRQAGATNPLSLSKVVNSGKCTARSIATLAFEDKVTVEGKYSYFAPVSTPSSIKINVDYAVEVEDLVLPQQSIIHTTSHFTRAVVWYQGRPHILARCGRFKDAWFILTKIKGKVELRTLDSSIELINSVSGKYGKYVKKSGLDIELDIRPGKVNPAADYQTYGNTRIFRTSKPPRKITGVLVSPGDCGLYRSKLPKLF
ncbi:Bgt-50958 [Blumeria graminis f. sp. tritici]|uniref:Bgt-50958 n=1 Tax=Blumeria graminis f. sp. tritici TaxID=62690 RepID=A0A9X9LAY2_BLUGR|nr:Bgt-50958 [Blumeria graminis f. sp. tritici]